MFAESTAARESQMTLAAMYSGHSEHWGLSVHIDFDEISPLDPATIYDYFKTPDDWPRLFGSFGAVTDRGNGWFAVPLRRSPFPLIARISAAEAGERVAWDLRGFWKGDGEVRFESVPEGTHITGHETVNVMGLPVLTRLLDRWLFPRFKAVWEAGWRKLHRVAESG